MKKDPEITEFFLLPSGEWLALPPLEATIANCRAYLARLRTASTALVATLRDATDNVRTARLEQRRRLLDIKLVPTAARQTQPRS